LGPNPRANLGLGSTSEDAFDAAGDGGRPGDLGRSKDPGGPFRVRQSLIRPPGEGTWIIPPPIAATKGSSVQAWLGPQVPDQESLGGNPMWVRIPPRACSASNSATDPVRGRLVQSVARLVGAARPGRPFVQSLART